MACELLILHFQVRTSDPFPREWAAFRAWLSSLVFYQVSAHSHECSTPVGCGDPLFADSESNPGPEYPPSSDPPPHHQQIARVRDCGSECRISACIGASLWVPSPQSMTLLSKSLGLNAEAAAALLVAGVSPMPGAASPGAAAFISRCLSCLSKRPRSDSASTRSGCFFA